MRIRCVDLETTGIDPAENAVCEVGWCDLVEGRFGWDIEEPRETLINPVRSIPPEVSAIHHIVDEDVQGKPFLGDVLDIFNDPAVDILAAHNAFFERGFITDGMTGGKRWICSYKGALRKWPEAPSHNNQALRYWRKPEGLDRQLALVAHRAGPDAYVTAFHIRDLLKIATIDELVQWSGEPALLPTCFLKKHKNQPWATVPSDYMRWVLTTDMDEDIKHTCRHHLQLREDAQRRQIEDYANGH